MRRTWYPSLSSSALRLAMRLGVFVRRSYALRRSKHDAASTLLLSSLVCPGNEIFHQLYECEITRKKPFKSTTS